MYPFTVWVIVTKDRSGKPNGFEKCGGKFYYTKLEAERDLILDFKNNTHIVVECVIMSKCEYDNN